MYFKFSKWAIKNGLVYDQIESLLSVSTVYSDSLRVNIYFVILNKKLVLFFYPLLKKTSFFSFNSIWNLKEYSIILPS